MYIFILADSVERIAKLGDLPPYGGGRGGGMGMAKNLPV